MHKHTQHTHTHIDARTHTHKHKDARTHRHTHTHTHALTTHTHTQARATHTHTDTRTHARTRTHTHTYALTPWGCLVQLYTKHKQFELQKIFLPDICSVYIYEYEYKCIHTVDKRLSQPSVELYFSSQDNEKYLSQIYRSMPQISADTIPSQKYKIFIDIHNVVFK